MKDKRLVTFLVLIVVLTMAVLPVMTGCAEPAAPTTPAPTTPTPAEPTPSEPAPAETITLNVLHGDQGIDERTWGWKSTGGLGWEGEVTRLSGGRVQFEHLIGSVNPFDAYDSLLMGAGDMYGSVILMNTGRWPSLEIMTVPDMFTVCQRPGKVAWDLWKKFPVIGEEFSDAKLIAIYASTPSPPGIGFCMKDKKIATLEDCKGVKMGIYGKWGTKMVDALGFTSVAVSQMDVYESIQRGIVDGSFMDTDFLSNQNVGELVDYWCPISLLFCPFYLSMNWDSWNKLPPDIQKIMEDVAPNIPDWGDYYLREDKIRIMAEWPEIEVLDFSPEEQARWRATQDPIQQEYIDMLNSQGIDAQPIFDEMQRLFEVYKDPLPESEIPPKGG
jgi:TRAP-type C4-dicarboxylate transport system substrate-binding protein